MSDVLIPLADGEPDNVVVIRDKQRISLAGLIGCAVALADTLPPAAYYVPLCRDRYNFAVAFCAALIKNATNLLPPNRQAVTVNEIGKNYSDCICLYDSEMELPSFRCINVTEVTDKNYSSDTIPSINSQHIAAIAFTSGSTGTPVPHKKRWRTFVGTTQKLAHRFFGDQSAEPTLVATVPSQHMYGLEMTVLMMLHGGCIMDAGHPFYPREVIARLQAITEPRVLVTTPIHMRSLTGSGLAIPVIAKTISATAPLPAELAAEAEKTFGGPVEEIYGFTEAGSAATRRTVAGARWDLLDGMQLSLRNEEIVVSGDHLDGITPLQDKLNVLSPTQFEFIGRNSDLLNVGGKRASLADLSHKLLLLEGVDDAVVFLPDDNSESLTQRPAALLVTQVDKQTICRRIAEIIDPVFVPRPIKVVDKLPRSENGKLQRAQLLQLIQSEHE